MIIQNLYRKAYRRKSYRDMTILWSAGFALMFFFAQALVNSI